MIVRWGLHELPTVLADVGVERPLLVASPRWDIDVDAVLTIALERPEMRKHPVCTAHWLSTLKVRVRRHQILLERNCVIDHYLLQ